VSLARAAVTRPVTTVASVLAIVLLGSVSLGRTPVSLLPDVQLPVLTVRTLYTGAAAEEVSRFIAEPVEEAMAATPGLVELRSVSRNGEATTTARFAWGTDMQTTLLNVRAERPTLLTSDPGERPIAVLSMSIAGDMRQLARTAEDVHARRLEQIAGVASVAVVGAPEDEVRIEVDPARMRALALTPNDVSAAIRAANVNGVGGTIRRGQFRFSVRTLTEFRSPDEIRDVPVGPPGAGITLKDLATVTTTIADPKTLTRFDSKAAVGLVVYKDAGSNTVQVTGEIQKVADQLRTEFPTIGLTIVAAQANFVIDALSNLGQEIIIGGVLSLALILLFLRDWRMSLAIGIMIPLSVLLALVLLQALDVTIPRRAGVRRRSPRRQRHRRRRGSRAKARRGAPAIRCRHRGDGGGERPAHCWHADDPPRLWADHLRARTRGGALPRSLAFRGHQRGGVADSRAHADAGDDRGTEKTRRREDGKTRLGAC
jgi:hydrophobic/amphiphilic exporter-1 (mainly G- bacteria), HAE1 family